MEDYNDNIFAKAAGPMMASDPTAKAEKIETLFNEVLPKFMPLVEE